jgi:acyl dehydratase
VAKVNDGDTRITDEMVETVRARMNKRIPGKPWVQYATQDTIRHAAMAVGDENPLWTDSAYAQATRFGSIIAPPMFPYASVSMSASVGGMGFPGIFTLHAQDEWRFERPVKVGDTMNATIALVGLEQRESRWGGVAYHQTTEFRFTNQDDEVISVYTPLYVRAERGKAREKNKYAGFETYKYTDEEIEQIEAGYESEERRGDKPRYDEDVTVGMSVGHVVKGPLTVTDMICWWMGMGAPYLFAFGVRHNRLKERPGLAIVDPETNIRHTPEIAHFDEKYALRSGVGAAYDIGRQRTAWFLHLLTNWAGDDAWVTYIKARFEKPNYVGDTTWCTGKVVEKAIRDGVPQVKVEMQAKTQRGVVHATGYAWVQLPLREKK